MTLHYQDDAVTLHCGNAGDIVRELEPGSVQTVVTSPPYYGLRDYNEVGQIGAERSVTEYVDRLRDVFEGVRQALADDGTVWLNLGDSYTGSWGNQGKSEKNLGLHKKVVESGAYRRERSGLGSRREGEPAAKNLLGVPWRMAFALQEDGWFLRSEIIWAKPNPMPSSVTDRPTSSHEHIFLLAKAPRYYYDGAAIAEPIAESTVMPRVEGNRHRESNPSHTNTGGKFAATTANKRDVWTVASAPFAQAHFATYPPPVDPSVHPGRVTPGRRRAGSLQRIGDDRHGR